MQRLHVQASTLEERVDGGGRVPDARRQVRLALRNGEPLGLQRVAHALDHLAQLVGLGVGDPVRAAGRGVGHLGP